MDPGSVTEPTIYAGGPGGARTSAPRSRNERAAVWCVHTARCGPLGVVRPHRTAAATAQGRGARGVGARPGRHGSARKGVVPFLLYYTPKPRKTSQKSRKTVAKTSQKPRKNLPKTSQKPRENLAKTSLRSVSFILHFVVSFYNVLLFVAFPKSALGLAA